MAERGRRWDGLVSNLLRGALAAVLSYYCLMDWPAARARADLVALPDYPFGAEARRLQGEGRLSEALLVLDAAQAHAPVAERAALATLRVEVEREREHWLTRLQQAGRGAWTGTGDSSEALAGAIVADLFVFGDVRDLVIQGGRVMRNEPPDMLIVGLSTAGLVLTAQPSADLGAAVLKFGRRAGGVSEPLAREIADMARRAGRTGRHEPLLGTLADAGRLSRRMGPAPAMAVLRHVETPMELQRAARLAATTDGAFALWVGGRRGLVALADASPSMEALLLKAAAKGSAGLERAAGLGPRLLRAHPLTGLVKGHAKGHFGALLERLLERHALALLGVALAWLTFEALLLLRRLGRGV